MTAASSSLHLTTERNTRCSCTHSLHSVLSEGRQQRRRLQISSAVQSVVAVPVQAEPRSDPWSRQQQVIVGHVCVTNCVKFSSWKTNAPNDSLASVIVSSYDATNITQPVMRETSAQSHKGEAVLGPNSRRCPKFKEPATISSKNKPKPRLKLQAVML